MKYQANKPYRSSLSRFVLATLSGVIGVLIGLLASSVVCLMILEATTPVLDVAHADLPTPILSVTRAQTGQGLQAAADGQLVQPSVETVALSSYYTGPTLVVVSQ